MSMKSKLESAYAKALTGTFKVINPIKKTIKKTECEVHLYIQENALEILNCNGYSDEYKLFKEYKSKIDEGLVWADQDFKCYHHFYNPKEEKGDPQFIGAEILAQHVVQHRLHLLFGQQVDRRGEGMDIIFVTTANTDEEARELLTLFGMPFKK